MALTAFMRERKAKLKEARAKDEAAVALLDVARHVKVTPQTLAAAKAVAKAKVVADAAAAQGAAAAKDARRAAAEAAAAEAADGAPGRALASPAEIDAELRRKRAEAEEAQSPPPTIMSNLQQKISENIDLLFSPATAKKIKEKYVNI
jgi:hypothetical protein